MSQQDDEADRNREAEERNRWMREPLNLDEEWPSDRVVWWIGLGVVLILAGLLLAAFAGAVFGYGDRLVQRGGPDVAPEDATLAAVETLEIKWMVISARVDADAAMESPMVSWAWVRAEPRARVRTLP